MLLLEETDPAFTIEEIFQRHLLSLWPRRYQSHCKSFQHWPLRWQPIISSNAANLDEGEDIIDFGGNGVDLGDPS